MEHFENEWHRRGKKYKANTLAALKQLYGNQNNDKDCQLCQTKKTEQPRETGANQVCDLAEETKLQGSS